MIYIFYYFLFSRVIERWVSCVIAIWLLVMRRSDGVGDLAVVGDWVYLRKMKVFSCLRNFTRLVLLSWHAIFYCSCWFSSCLRYVGVVQSMRVWAAFDYRVSAQDSGISNIWRELRSTYDHRLRSALDPVHLPHDKPLTARPVVRCMTPREAPLLYVSWSFFFERVIITLFSFLAKITGGS